MFEGLSLSCEVLWPLTKKSSVYPVKGVMSLALKIILPVPESRLDAYNKAVGSSGYSGS